VRSRPRLPRDSAPRPRYSEFLTDEAMAALYRSNAEALGRVFSPGTEGTMKASTDMGNVSLAIPSIHRFSQSTRSSGQPSSGIRGSRASPAADRAVLDGAVAMAWTTIDLREKRPCGNASARRRTGTREAAALKAAPQLRRPGPHCRITDWGGTPRRLRAARLTLLPESRDA